MIDRFTSKIYLTEQFTQSSMNLIALVTAFGGITLIFGEDTERINSKDPNDRPSIYLFLKMLGLSIGILGFIIFIILILYLLHKLILLKSNRNQEIMAPPCSIYGNITSQDTECAEYQDNPIIENEDKPTIEGQDKPIKSNAEENKKLDSQFKELEQSASKEFTSEFIPFQPPAKICGPLKIPPQPQRYLSGEISNPKKKLNSTEIGQTNPQSSFTNTSKHSDAKEVVDLHSPPSESTHDIVQPGIDRKKGSIAYITKTFIAESESKCASQKKHSLHKFIYAIKTKITDHQTQPKGNKSSITTFNDEISAEERKDEMEYSSDVPFMIISVESCDKNTKESLHVIEKKTSLQSTNIHKNDSTELKDISSEKIICKTLSGDPNIYNSVQQKCNTLGSDISRQHFNKDNKTQIVEKVSHGSTENKSKQHSETANDYTKQKSDNQIHDMKESKQPVNIEKTPDVNVITENPIQESGNTLRPETSKIHRKKKKTIRTPAAEKIIEEPKQVTTDKQKSEVITSVEKPKPLTNDKQKPEVITTVEKLKPVTNDKQKSEVITSVEKPKPLTNDKQKSEVITSVEKPKPVTNDKQKSEAITTVEKPKPVTNNKQKPEVITSVEKPKQVTIDKQNPEVITSVEKPKLVTNDKQNPEVITSVEKPKQVTIDKQKSEVITSVEKPKQETIDKQKSEVITSVEKPKQETIDKQKSEVITSVEKPKPVTNYTYKKTETARKKDTIHNQDNKATIANLAQESTNKQKRDTTVTTEKPKQETNDIQQMDDSNVTSEKPKQVIYVKKTLLKHPNDIYRNQTMYKSKKL